METLLVRTQSPFKFIPEVELWKLQFGSDERWSMYGRESRSKFLVLHGPSMYGKTQYAKSLFGFEHTLVVQCQNVDVPNLQAFRRSKHKAVIYDECPSTLIVKHKALFQGNTDGALLGQSTCNEYAYWVFLYGVAQIICCNDWLAGIKEGTQEMDWLLANSIVYEVNEKTYVD